MVDRQNREVTLVHTLKQLCSVASLDIIIDAGCGIRQGVNKTKGVIFRLNLVWKSCKYQPFLAQK